VTAALRALGHLPMPVLKAIRAKCLDCSGGMQSEVRECVVRDCALYPFRMGSNPWRAAPTEAQRQSGARIAIAVGKRRNGPASDATDESDGGGCP
jgi:hypothetical protein